MSLEHFRISQIKLPNQFPDVIFYLGKTHALILRIIVEKNAVQIFRNIRVHSDGELSQVQHFVFSHEAKKLFYRREHSSLFKANTLSAITRAKRYNSINSITTFFSFTLIVS
jgi:hypothetical protein